MNQEHRKLFDLYIEAELYGIGFEKCVDWAVEQIIHGVDDMQINILAGSNANDSSEIRYYVQKILGDDLKINDNKIESWVGKHIVYLANEFLAGKIDIQNLDSKLSTIYNKLEYPDWLVMLTRNCEYATDIDTFKKPFLDELNYIAGLWAVSNEINEFLAKYSRKISNSHDFNGE